MYRGPVCEPTVVIDFPKMASPYLWLLQTTAGCVLVGIIFQLLIPITLSSRSLGQEKRNTIPNSEKKIGVLKESCA